MKKLLNVVLASLLALQTGVFAAQPPSKALSPTTTSNDFRLHKALENIEKPLVIRALENATEDQVPLEIGLTANDPSLDQDPFFLRSQQWTQVKQDNKGGVSAQATDDGVVIHVPAARKELRIQTELNPILITDDYIFFAARKGFKGFEKASSGLLNAAEGIFFVSYSEVLASLETHFAVPVYHLPLPSTGWTGDVKAFNFVADEIITVASSDNERTILPLRLTDIKQVMDAEKFNLYMALETTLMRMGTRATSVKDLRELKPEPGLTAGFGVLFTGIDSQNPAASEFPLSNQSAKLSAQFTKSLASLGGFLKSGFELKEAQAASFAISPKLRKRLIKMATVVSVSLIASVVLKHTVYRDFFKRKHAAEETKNQASLVKRILRPVTHEISDVGDVFAHSLTVLSQAPGVLFANGVEFLGDRYLPQLAAADNTLIRKFLNKTVYWVRKTNDETPVSGKTWLFGAIVLGGEDTFFVVYQLYHTIPWICDGIGQVFPSMKPRAEAVSDNNNPLIDNIRQNEAVRNASSYIISGASSLSSDLFSQLIDRVTNQIKQEMRDEGIDPADPRNAEVLKNRIAPRMDAEMQRMGYPGKTSFLFDVNTIYNIAASTLGYALPPALVQKNSGEDSKKFMARKRPGLVVSSTIQAIKDLKAELKLKPVTGSDNDKVKEAVSLLEGTLSDMRELMPLVQGSIETIQVGGVFQFNVEYYTKVLDRTRESMMVLSYEGDPGDVIDYVPEAWKGSDPESIWRAARAYQKTMDGFIQGIPEPKKPHEPQKKGFVIRWQERKAIVKASERFLSEQGHTFNVLLASQEEANRFKALYSTALAEIVGLYPDFENNEGLEERVWKTAEMATTAQLNNEGVQAYLSKLGALERLQFEANVQAKNFTESYMKTVMVSGDYAPTSPAQPGVYQKLRQRPEIRQSSFRTRIHRGMEFMFPNDQFQTGAMGVAYRHVPFLYDSLQSNLRIYRGMLTKALAGYPYSYLLWGINLPASMWTFALVTGFLIGAPAQALNRFFANQGWKPMGKLWAMMGFGFIYTWATFGGGIPQQFFADDFDRIFKYVVYQHGVETLLATAAAGLTYQLGKTLLSRRGQEKETRDVNKKITEVFRSIKQRGAHCAEALGEL